MTNKAIYTKKLTDPPVEAKAYGTRSSAVSATSSLVVVGCFKTLGVCAAMSLTKRPTGHPRVKLDKNGRTRSFK